ncbi:MAG TPA: hypothetical protein VGR11_01775, partial [Solirubrobacteraceae bacterium]|nr:hypothetical protein [Solirubrobacteraceae bacterium]
MRRVRYVLALGLCVLLTSALAPSTAAADTLRFSGRSGTQTWWTWAPNVGLRPYRIGTTIRASVYASRARYVAVASIGISYSTEALGPDTLLVYGLQYRKKGGHWRPVCVRRICLFRSRKRAPWPGERLGARYFETRLPIMRSRNIEQIKL